MLSQACAYVQSHQSSPPEDTHTMEVEEGLELSSHKIAVHEHLTHCLLLLSADNLCKKFGPRSGPTKS